MTWKDTLNPILSNLPSVNRPTGHVPFNRKLLWTGLVLLVYFYLTNVLVFGLPEASTGTDVFGQFRSILAGGQGTLLTVGIGPIVTGSIILQLLDGADLLPLDTEDDPRDQALYQNIQKSLVLIVTALTASTMIFLGGFLPASSSLAQTLGISVGMLKWVMFAQVFAGGVIILYLDEIVSKWGIGSGVGLFIIAGVSQRLFGGIFSIPTLGEPGVLYSWYSILFGEASIGSLFTADGITALFMGAGNLLPIITTVLIVTIVIYAESVRVEIPISHSQVKGARGRFPVKLIYASVLPMILVRALQMNLQFLGRIINQQLGPNMPTWLGIYTNNQPVGGFFYYLAPIQRPQDWMWWLGQSAATQEVWQIALRVGVDLTFMVIGGAVFAIFWVKTTGMGPEATAEQLQGSGMQIPGFRKNPQIFKKVMARYIPYVTVIGGALVGILAVMANMLGTIGGVTGTGLLLAVSITYKLYEEIAEEKMMDMHPMMRKMFGKD